MKKLCSAVAVVAIGASAFAVDAVAQSSVRVG